MSQITPLPAPQGEATGQATAAETAKPSPPPHAPAHPLSAPESNQRLVIQESGELGVFVYTVIDRTTGQVLTQIPREAVSDMAHKADYSAGKVISTTA